MARLGCICGEELTNTICPSPHRLKISFLSDINKAIAENPELTLWDYYTEWNSVENKQQNYDSHSKAIEYWYCTSCKRVYLVEAVPCGKWLKVYKPSYEANGIFMPSQEYDYAVALWDMKMDELLENSPGLLMKDFIASNPQRIAIGNQGTVAYMYDGVDNTVTLIYKLENCKE